MIGVVISTIELSQLIRKEGVLESIYSLLLVFALDTEKGTLIVVTITLNLKAGGMQVYLTVLLANKKGGRSRLWVVCWLSYYPISWRTC